ncbi:proline-rich protein HaeIII subfamily 1-like [Vidua macroura]|uniref:proline-rich protein HaeIII subfamily 1-like n=1 Tax=Vidua macroura TaxID=187451 RepID=UPI0023A86E37|nr:proline-rich protein HaeIII subfamily 1-like [Vidua macroura]
MTCRCSARCQGAISAHSSGEKRTATSSNVTSGGTPWQGQRGAQGGRGTAPRWARPGRPPGLCVPEPPLIPTGGVGTAPPPPPPSAGTPGAPPPPRGRTRRPLPPEPPGTARAHPLHGRAGPMAAAEGAGLGGRHEGGKSTGTGCWGRRGAPGRGGALPVRRRLHRWVPGSGPFPVPGGPGIRPPPHEQRHPPPKRGSPGTPPPSESAPRQIPRNRPGDSGDPGAPHCRLPHRRTPARRVPHRVSAPRDRDTGVPPGPALQPLCPNLPEPTRVAPGVPSHTPGQWHRVSVSQSVPSEAPV